MLDRRPENCRVLKIENPILNDLDLLKIKHMKRPGFQVATVSILFYKTHRWIRLWKKFFLR